MCLLRPLTCLLAVSSLVLLLGGALVLTRAPAPAPVYAVAQVQVGLANHPQAWLGRVVWVRGVADPCPWWGEATRLWQCADDPLILVPARTDPVAAPLPLGQPAPNGILAALRRLPLLRALVAAPRAVPVYTTARFRVRLHRLAASACGGRAPCYEAQLLAAVPVTR